MMKRRSTGNALTLAGLLVLCANASACGVCIEDKVAVTYDHAVVRSAIARHHVVVFAAIEANGNAASVVRQVKAAAMRAPGVDRDSVRAAAEPAAISFALDPSLTGSAAAIAAIEKTAEASKARLSVLRVVR